MSDYFELVSSRESCRNYNPDRRPTREQLVKCIQTAQLAPSAFTELSITEKSPLVAAATQTAGLNKFTNNCPAFVIVCEEDAYLIGGKEPNQKYAHIDIGLSVSQLCYAATQQGLSTCIMGSFDQKMLLDSLGITEPKRVLLVVAVGYAATDALRPKKRKPLDEVMTYIG